MTPVPSRVDAKRIQSLLRTWLDFYQNVKERTSFWGTISPMPVSSEIEVDQKLGNNILLHPVSMEV